LRQGRSHGKPWCIGQSDIRCCVDNRTKAARHPYCAFFNGRLEDPAILIGAHDGPEPLEPDKAKCLAWWDFSAEIATDMIIDRGPHGMHGHLRNLPTRAVHGSHWTPRSSGGARAGEWMHPAAVRGFAAWRAYEHGAAGGFTRNGPVNNFNGTN
jgi:hypothetical protein